MQSEKEDLELDAEWFKIRDTFFGHNRVEQNISLALAQAKACKHQEALWLSNVCDGKIVTNKDEARELFTSLGANDARGLCFAGCCMEDLNCVVSWRRSAELGNAFAQAKVANWTCGQERLKFAMDAARQGERDGYFWVGEYFLDGEECEKDWGKALEHFILAAELGCASAIEKLGNLLDESDPRRWYWLGKAEVLGFGFGRFMSTFSLQVANFFAGCGNPKVVFAIGQVLKSRVNGEEKNSFFSFDCFDGPRIRSAFQAIEFYKSQVLSAQKAVHAWGLVGVRLGIVRDLRRFIAGLIWDARSDAMYSFL
jgi:hypothetical protein